MDIKTAQDRFYDLLIKIDEICTKENILWFLEGGTELGAIREGNFIAWDDDVDIKVLREDYDKFKKAMKQYLPSNYKIVEPEDISPAFYDYVTRIINIDTPLGDDTKKDDYYKNYTNRFCIDVFVFDKAPDNGLLQKLYKFKFQFIYGMLMSKRYSIDYSDYSFFSGLKVRFCVLLGKLYKTDTLLKTWHREMTKYSNRKTSYRFPSNSMILRGLNFYDEACYEKAIRFKIRDYEFPVPVGYDSELTLHYGDYMTPHHDDNIYKPHF